MNIMKSKDPKKIFSNFSFFLNGPNKNYFVEYVFKPNGTVTATNMTTCKSMKYNWTFKGRGSRSNDHCISSKTKKS